MASLIFSVRSIIHGLARCLLYVCMFMGTFVNGAAAGSRVAVNLGMIFDPAHITS